MTGMEVAARDPLLVVADGERLELLKLRLHTVKNSMKDPIEEAQIQKEIVGICARLGLFVDAEEALARMYCIHSQMAVKWSDVKESDLSNFITSVISSCASSQFDEAFQQCTALEENVRTSIESKDSISDQCSVIEIARAIGAAIQVQRDAQVTRNEEKDGLIKKIEEEIASLREQLAQERSRSQEFQQQISVCDTSITSQKEELQMVQKHELAAQTQLAELQRVMQEASSSIESKTAELEAQVENEKRENEQLRKHLEARDAEIAELRRLQSQSAPPPSSSDAAASESLKKQPQSSKQDQVGAASSQARKPHKRGRRKKKHHHK